MKWDPYAILGVPRDATLEEIRAAHRKRRQERWDARDAEGFDELQFATDAILDVMRRAFAERN